ncbi:UDP-galactopyranose mutase [Erysipelothrix sp. HDW6C]|uniref:UDP-galactopyranose mutase n=1 Tax=Erysipelothrix sp. HDW6C TaxID=2714930 RepID=UPI0014083268|nr:UDP-galactopyranose mutase [Erysipelothrix sp. HDW6C]QIK69452.1 UDP-galactopyranose mutase [Erysipelothrix sp. HDW6C]
MKYDYLVVGAGPFGSIFAYEATKRGKRVLVIDKREHVGGNLYCKPIAGINVHWYGAHIFHTSNKSVWDYVNQFATFNHFTNAPLANYKGTLLNLPFNMNTFNRLWGVNTPEQAKQIIAEQRKNYGVSNPKNLEEQAINLVGLDIYEKLIKGYTEKQWGRPCTELPAFIIKRLPVRYTFDNNYFTDIYQGIPVGGYNVLFDKWLKDIDVTLNADYFENRTMYEGMAEKIIFTGMIDQYYDYEFGELEYRSLRFEHELLESDNYQGNAVINYTDRETEFTRIIEHKHFEFGQAPKTVITREYPQDYTKDVEPYYPINDALNNEIYEKYRQKAEKEAHVIFGGRLGQYRYFDMHHIIENVLKLVDTEFDNQ